MAGDQAGAEGTDQVLLKIQEKPAGDDRGGRRLATPSHPHASFMTALT